jgi:hypothetical protein
VLFATAPLQASAQTTLRGQVTDRTTGQGVIGAQIELRRGATVVQTAASGEQGRWQMSVDAGSGPQAQNFKLVVTSRLYAEAAPDVVVASGAALQPVIDVALVRLSVAECLPRLARPRRIVVTNFLPPAQATGAGSFAERVAGALRQQLVFLERSGLADALQHTVVACAQIDDSENLAALARELKADALMGGQIAQTPPPPAARYTVTMRLRDAHGLFDAKEPIRSPGVDLDDPTIARLAPDALAGVVQGLVAGHAKERRYAECVQLANLALNALPRSATSALLAQRDDCLREQPAQKLTRGAG